MASGATTDRIEFPCDAQASLTHADSVIDNLNNRHHWNFHPYPQRSYSAELSFTL